MCRFVTLGFFFTLKPFIQFDNIREIGTVVIFSGIPEGKI